MSFLKCSLDREYAFEAVDRNLLLMPIFSQGRLNQPILVGRGAHAFLSEDLGNALHTSLHQVFEVLAFLHKRLLFRVTHALKSS